MTGCSAAGIASRSTTKMSCGSFCPAPTRWVSFETPRSAIEVAKKPQTQTPDEPTNPGRRYGTLQQAAEYINVSTKTIRQMVEDGRLTGYRYGPRLLRVDLSELDSAIFGGDAA